ncbi:hypothetical protein NQ317_015261 [Molorchus minor]|uniref:Uncharacterized protein n=1 Tax=Molorchus minor TaxID=1323400 RepID=A0ABQ9IXE3_9CUCU|nr:hypothetical protein NQ317_015261 [Molorchus minor]
MWYQITMTQFLSQRPHIAANFWRSQKCWTKQINETCPHSADLDKFSKDYTEAMKKPCNS